MAVIIQKFGGTSVGSIDRIKEVALIIKNELAKGNKVIVIVSAMAGITNQLVSLCSEVSGLTTDNELAEYDVALSTGEAVASSLLALCLQDIGIKARSVLAWQLPIITNRAYSKALVESINNNILLEYLEKDIIPVIAGFQGRDSELRLTTLGRGGSDTTAVLVAAACKADRCDIYTDVEGVYSCDPRLVHNARKLLQISYEEMLEFASSGAKVLHPRSSLAAMRYNIPLRVLSSFSQDSGTIITAKDKIMEKRLITGIAYNKSLIDVTLNGLKVTLSNIVAIFSKENIHIEYIASKLENSCQFIVPLADKNKLSKVLEYLQDKSFIHDFLFNQEISLVTIVGYNLKTDTSFIAKIIEKLESENIDIKMMQLNEIKIALCIDDKNTDKAIKLLHTLID